MVDAHEAGPAALAMASAGMAALASTLMPIGRPKLAADAVGDHRHVRAVSGPIASGLEKGTSPWFSMMTPSQPPWR